MARCLRSTRVYSSSFYETSHNSGTGKRIDIKPGSQTQLNKVNMKMSKNSNNDVARANYEIILILALFTKCGALWRPDSDMVPFNSRNSILRQLLFCDKIERKTKKVIEPVNYYFQNSYFFQKKMIKSWFYLLRKYYHHQISALVGTNI